jgi:hypothetical protein
MLASKGVLKMPKEPYGFNRRTSQKKKTAPTAHALQRGRPSQEHIRAEIQMLAEQALDVIHGGHGDATEQAERLLSGPDWPGIQQIQETAQRESRYAGLSAWQALIYQMEYIVDSEITWRETQLCAPNSKGTLKREYQSELTFLTRYLIDGISQRALASVFDRDHSTISRFKSRIYYKLSMRALDFLSGKFPQPPAVATRIRNDVTLRLR